MPRLITPLFVITLSMLSACVALSPAGARIHIITEDQRTQVSTCEYLDTVSVSSEDALRNHTAALSGDTALISNHLVGSVSIVKGEVFRCTARTDNSLSASSPDQTDPEYLRKSTLCQSKDGVWISNQCVIPIE